MPSRFVPTPAETVAPLRLPDGRELSFGARRRVMGILNATPDSFSDGGEHAAPPEAIAHGLWLLEQGADLVDVGGESTRPGADPVDQDEELARVVPVIEGVLAEAPEAIVSIDTTKAAVAAAALEAGASLVNDVSGLTADEGMLEVVAEAGAPLVLMHMRGTPRTMRQMTDYEDVVEEVCARLAAQVERAVDAGIEPRQIVLDPGIGFAKTAAQSYALMERLGRLCELGHAVLLGTSRKSFLGARLGKSVGERRWGTAASLACGVMAGAHILRVHDVAEAVDVVRVAEAICDPALTQRGGG